MLEAGIGHHTPGSICWTSSMLDNAGAHLDYGKGDLHHPHSPFPLQKKIPPIHN